MNSKGAFSGFGPAALGFAAVAVLMLLASGPGTRLGLWDFRTGFWLLRYGAYVGAGAAVFAILLLLIAKTRRGNLATLILALLVGAACFALPLQFRARGGTVPPINDISTDFANPAFAEQQKQGYPDLKPLELSEPPAAAYARALAAAQAMGWEIVKQDAKAGSASRTTSRCACPPRAAAAGSTCARAPASGEAIWVLMHGGSVPTLSG
jgi:hypothetical protein